MNHKKFTCCPYYMCPYWMYCNQCKWHQNLAAKNKRLEPAQNYNYLLEDDTEDYINDEYEETFNEEYIHNSDMIDIDPKLFRVSGELNRTDVFL